MSGTQDLPTKLVKFWPLIVSLLGGMLAIGEARFRVVELEAKAATVEQRFDRISRERDRDKTEHRNELNTSIDKLGLKFERMMDEQQRTRLAITRLCARMRVDCTED